MEKSWILAGAMAFGLGLAGTAAADADDPLDRQGDRIERHLDRRGDRIERHLDRRGDRIDRRLDRRGHRVGHRRGAAR